ncbi:enoyl-CoA hydratase/isomerase family protein [Microbacterium sp. E-13]|uniref:enoyl-CoA hydratase/isomerase family protein n=1 Tax=Microbacterium sp. E-13 TaxID=3404048 RepID=UPI003CF2077E
MTQLRTTVSAGVGLIEIHHVARNNALTASMWRRVPSILDDWEQREEVLAVVLRGAGGTFSAGADIDDVLAILFDDSQEDLISRATGRLARFPKPTLAVIEGHCIGGGWELAGACDLRVATRSAVFGVTPARLGVVYPVSGVRRLVDLVGPGVARQLLLTAELVPAERAYRWGMVTALAEDSEIDEVAAGVIRTLLSRSQLSVRAAKELIVLNDDPEAQRTAHDRWATVSLLSGELEEGRRAFRERRPPVFPWRTEPAAAASGSP